MKSRRTARVFAMQILYGMEITSGTPGDVLPGVLESLQPDADHQNYGMTLVDQVQEHRKSLDDHLRKYSEGWDPERMPLLDRIIMEIAMIEMLLQGEIPVKVAIQEAVQIANKYSTAESSSFINGILDHFAKDGRMLQALKPTSTALNDGGTDES